MDMLKNVRQVVVSLRKSRVKELQAERINNNWKEYEKGT